MGRILPSEVQRWVTTATTTATATATGKGLSAAAVGKYHTMLHSVLERALRDRVVTFNTCAHTELPKMIKKQRPRSTPVCAVASSHRPETPSPRRGHVSAHRRGDHR